MTVEDAQEFFKAVPSIREKMDALMRVGLGYIKVGQQATTLSGGEAQRVKLSKELSKRSTGRTLYILDEPTTGLHFEDVRKLLEVLHELVDQGNSVVVIEHNLDVVKTADYIIDIGPEGGDGGGEIVATGTPEEVAGVVAQPHWALPEANARCAGGRGRIASTTSEADDGAGCFAVLVPGLAPAIQYRNRRQGRNADVHHRTEPAAGADRSKAVDQESEHQGRQKDCAPCAGVIGIDPIGHHPEQWFQAARCVDTRPDGRRCAFAVFNLPAAWLGRGFHLVGSAYRIDVSSR